MENEFFNVINNIKADETAVTLNGDRGAKSLNILLVELINRQFQSQNFPLQLFVLAGAIAERGSDGRVKKRKHDVTIAQSNTSEGIINYLARSSQTNRAVDVVGISAHHGNWNNLTQTLSAFRSIPETQRPYLILGGHLASHLQSKLLGDFADLPISIAVEHGDIPFRSYINWLSLHDASGGIGKIPGIVDTSNRILIPTKNISNNYPWLDGVPFADNNPNKVARMETSRGCFYNHCTFCDRPAIQREWVKYSLNDVTSQMLFLTEIGYRKFTFSDEEIVGNDPERFTELLHRIKGIRSQYSDLGFFINARVDNIVSANPSRQDYLDNMWKVAKEAGAVVVWVGAESYSPRQLTLYNKGKGISPQSNLDSLRKLHSAGLSVVQGFIPFHPLMSEAELSENIGFIRQHSSEIVPSLDNPLGFLRVSQHTGYLRHILKQQEKMHMNLIKEFDPNTLSYPSAYLNPKLGLLVSFLYTLNAFTRTGTKHIQWDGNIDNRLARMRSLNFSLLDSAYQTFMEAASIKSLETQLVTDLLPRYQEAVNQVRIDGVAKDFQDVFAPEFERNKSIFLF